MTTLSEKYWNFDHRHPFLSFGVMLVGIYLATVLLMAGGITFFAGCAALLTPAQVVVNPRVYVHKLEISTTMGTGHGSGVMLAPGLMITAAHVVVAGTLGDYHGKQAKALYVDRKRDIALVAVDLPCPCVKVADVDAAPDTPVTVVGYPINLGQYETHGRAQGVHTKYVAISAPIAPGNSGGGVFTKDRNGNWQLVGISDAIACAGGPLGETCFSTMGVAINVKAIRHVLAVFECRFGTRRIRLTEQARLGAATQCAELARG